MRRVGSLAALGLLVAAACNGSSPPAPPAGTVDQLTIAEASLLIDQNVGNPAFYVLDVRTPTEFAAGHLEDAENVDFMSGSFEADVSAYPLDGIYLVHCQAGFRSAGAADAMHDLGFLEIHDMPDGFAGWVAAGMPWTTQ
ncbi:MAG: rhodanese-like domain-containing protein [Planctomycetota bacterium]|jgi:rhodanese-related sulfurtransferase